MKSGKQRREEIKAKRRKKAEALKGEVNVHDLSTRPLYSVVANPEELKHNHTYRMMPLFYVDKPFICIDCGSHELWTAKQQKWWYEVAKGNIDSTAVRCRGCRKKEQARKAESRKIHLEGLAKKKL